MGLKSGLTAQVEGRNAAEDAERFAQRMGRRLDKDGLTEELKREDLWDQENAEVEHSLACTAYYEMDVRHRYGDSWKPGGTDDFGIPAGTRREDEGIRGREAMVTRPCAKQEMLQPETFEARQEEVGKTLRFGAWDVVPIEWEEARRTKGFCGTMVLDSVKHAERPLHGQERKSRFVGRGDMVTDHHGRRAAPSVTRGALWCPVTSLDGARCVIDRHGGCAFAGTVSGVRIPLFIPGTRSRGLPHAGTAAVALADGPTCLQDETGDIRTPIARLPVGRAVP